MIKPKRKKKNIEGMGTIEFVTCKNPDKIVLEKTREESMENINDCGTNECKTKTNTFADTLVNNNCNITTEMAKGECVENVSECVTPKKKLKSKSVDTLLQNNFNINDASLKILKPEKKKHHKKNISSKDLTTNNIPEENISYCGTVDYFVEKDKYKINKCTDITSLENNFSKNNVSFKAMKPKRKKHHEKSVSSEDSTVNNISEENISYCGIIDCVVKKNKCTINKSTDLSSFENNLSINDESCLVQSKVKNEYEEGINSISSSNNKNGELFNDIHISSQEEDELEGLLNDIGLYASPNDTNATENKINLKNFDLAEYLMNSNSSLKNHKEFSLMLDKVSVQMKKILDSKCQIVSQSDIEILKIIGEKLLRKISEKLNSAKSIQDIRIHLPLGSEKNKIHYVETTLCKYPSEMKMSYIRSLNSSVKLGTFNDEEDNLIRKYWSKFQEEYNISDVIPFLSNGFEMALPLSERLNFFRYISVGLPNRLLCSVYNRFNILFNEKLVDKLSFSNNEDQLILKVDGCKAIRNKYAVLSLILNRTRLQLYRRLHTLKMQPFRGQRIMWNSCRRQELFTNILLETNIENWKDLKNMTIRKRTWIKISERCNEPINYEKIKLQWKVLSTMLFCETTITYLTLKLTILELLFEINPSCWTDLNWVEITNKLYPGANSKFIVTMFHWWLKAVPKELKSNIKDTLKYISDNMVDSIQKKINEGKDKVFPRLTVKDGLLIEVYQ